MRSRNPGIEIPGYGYEVPPALNDAIRQCRGHFVSVASGFNLRSFGITSLQIALDRRVVDRACIDPLLQIGAMFAMGVTEEPTTHD